MKKKCLIVGLLAAVMCCSAFAAGCKPTPPDPPGPPDPPDPPDPPVSEVLGIDAWVESSYVNVFRDFTLEDTDKKTAEFVTAKNEYESVQIVLRSTKTFTIEDVRFSDLTCGESTIDKSNLKYNYVEYVRAVFNSQNVNASLIREAPEDFPDALSNEKSLEVDALDAQPVWVTLYVPKTADAGTYTGKATVVTNKGEIDVPVSAEVNDVTVPDAGSDESNYNIIFWQLMIGGGFGKTYADSHASDTMVKHFGCERWTEDWWKIVGDIADLMKENRLNTLYLPTVQLLLDGGSVRNGDGTWTFNFSKFDEYVEFFLERGVVNRFMGYMMMTGGNTNCILREEDGRSCTGTVKFDSADSDAWFDAYLPALYEHLHAKGWADRWTQCLRDEPPTDTVSVTQYKRLAEIYKRHMKEIPFGDPTQTNENSRMLLEMNAPTLIPLISIRNDNPLLYRNLDENQTVYTYSCVVPQGSYLNRYIDMPVYYGRSIAWWNYNVGASGFLHWGLMAWYRPITDFALGDTATIYPDVPNKTVKSSIRMASLRDGAEEYELLKMLGREDPAAAKVLADMVAKDAKTSYCKDTEELAEARAMLIRALGGKPGIVGKPESVTISEESLTLTLTEGATLTARVLPAESLSQAIDWSSNDPDVVSVNQNGEVWANAVGEAEITAACKEYPDVFDTITVTVVAPDSGEKVILVPYQDAFVRGGQFADYRYGTSSYADICLSTANNTYEAYLTFDASGFGNGVTRAVIRVYASEIGKSTMRTLALFASASDWRETELSGSTAPARGEKIAELAVTNDTGAARADWLEFDVTDYFKAHGEGIFTVCVADVSETANDNNRVRIYTRESSVNRPTLVVLGENMEYAPTALTGIGLAQTLSMKIGEQHTLEPTVLPEGALRQRFRFASDNEEIAFVSRTGVVTAFKAGEAKLTVTSLDNPAVKAECTVTVSEDERVKAFFCTDDATIESHRPDMNFGAQSSFLTNYAAPKRNAVLQFYVSGLVKPVASVRLRLYVTQSGMNANNGFGVYVNDGTFTESAVTYANAPKRNRKVGSYTVTNSTPGRYGGYYGWITVELDASCVAGDGTVSFTLIASSGDRVNFHSRNSDFCPVLEVDYGVPVTAIELTDKEIERPGETVRLDPVVTPAENHEPITYESSDPEIATVDADGVVTGVKEGQTTITARSGSVVATCTVTVHDYVDATSFVLDEKEVALTPTESKTVTVTFTPENANRGTELLWESSDPEVVYVNAATGVMIGRRAGTATVTATSAAFPDLKDTCTVTVGEADHTLSFTPTKDASVETHTTSTPGTRSDLWVYGNPKRYSVLEFDVQNLPSAAIGIKLKLYVTNTFSVDSTVRVYLATDREWDEATVNKNTAPVQTGSFLASAVVKAAAQNSWVEFSVNKSAITENGKITLILSLYSGSKGIYFSSREGVYRPTLTVDYGTSLADIEVNDFEATAGLCYKVLRATGHEVLQFTSSDDTIATVDGNGTLTALKAGTAVITVTNTTANAITKTCTVTVKAPKEGTQFLAPALDATLNGSGAGTNYGSNNNLHAIASSNMHFLMIFDLSAVEGTVTGLTLRMQLNNVGAETQTLGLYYAPSTDVTENGVKYSTWNGEYGEKIMDAVISQKIAGDFVEIVIDPSKLEGIVDGKLGIVMKIEEGVRLSFWSKEEKVNVTPMLIVETEPLPAPEPEPVENA